MGGQVKFGPDLEWIDEIDYHVNDNNLNKALTEIQKYLPIVKRDNLVGVYSGIRPKLISEKENKFQDFVIREESESGFKGFVNLLGIESPGLTSSLGIAKYVKEKFY
ncbi:unnamed protein product [Ambrosiozyma monospora]|uniref:L-2-hydroxyglutarate dehydrogenase, mitochondrial n=1 Tax=Ambrosiozyma monospora TaxID=43982 RepID=A0A9W6YRW9_AMBMO|nr:unnamed protein product [Ambrosiozyma monospora]